MLVFGILATLPFAHSIQCYSGSLSSPIDCRATTPRPTTVSTWSTWTYRPPTTYRPWHWHWNKPHRPWFQQICWHFIPDDKGWFFRWHYNHHGHHWHHWHRSGTNLTHPGGDAVILAKLVADAEKNCYIAYGEILRIRRIANSKNSSTIFAFRPSSTVTWAFMPIYIDFEHWRQ